MKLNNILVPVLFFFALVSCVDKNKSSEEIAEKERIVFEKTADSLEQLNTTMDTLNVSIKNKSDEIDALLNDIN